MHKLAAIEPSVRKVGPRAQVTLVSPRARGCCFRSIEIDTAVYVSSQVDLYR